MCIRDSRHPQNVTTLQYSEDARTLTFLSGQDRPVPAVVFTDHVRLYDPDTGRRHGAPIPVPQWTTTLALGAIDGTEVLAIAESGGIQLRVIATGAPFAPTVPTPSVPRWLAFARIDEREVILTSHFATVRVWDPRTGRLVSELRFGKAVADVAALSMPDGSLLVAVGGPGVAVTELHYDPFVPDRP